MRRPLLAIFESHAIFRLVVAIALRLYTSQILVVKHLPLPKNKPSRFLRDISV